MEFNLRAISLAESTAPDERIEPSTLLGSNFEFRTGIKVPITFPSDISAFQALHTPDFFLPSLFKWTRLYRYPASEGQILDALGVSDSFETGLRFKLIKMLQPSSSKGATRLPIQFLEGRVMDYDQCASWLIDVAEAWELDPLALKERLILSRPNIPRIRPLRFAWVGPDLVCKYPMSRRLRAIGRVYGVDLIHILPYSFSHVRARLKEEMPLQSVIVSRHYAPHITAAVVPPGLEEAALLCDSSDRTGLESQITSWIELVTEQLIKNAANSATEDEVLLRLMLRGMISHSKIGQYMHCDRATVLTGIRARRLNVPAAEGVLDAHCEQYQETKENDALFLWKDHHDGRQYFLNPKKVEEIKLLL